MPQFSKGVRFETIGIWCSGWVAGLSWWRVGLSGGAGAPGVLAEVAEVAFGEQVDLDFVDGDAWIFVRDGELDAPDFFAVFIQYRNCFTYSGCEAADGAWGFDEDGKSAGRFLLGRGVHIGLVATVRWGVWAVKWVCLRRGRWACRAPED